MSCPQPKDYATSGLSIQYAMLDHVKRFPNSSSRPQYILWGGRRIKTGDAIEVPKTGMIRAEFLAVKKDVDQGFDIKANGGIQLPDGRRVELLRTWYDTRYEPMVEYPFECEDRILRISNVYRMRYGGGQVIEEKWTGNAGFWVEKSSELDRVYHCSHGMAEVPDFDALVFRISILFPL